MVIADKIVTLLCLLAGFLWIRERARAVNLENQIGRSVIGVFVILPALLFGEKYIFDNFHFGPYTDLLLKAVLLILPFPLIGFMLLKRHAPESVPVDGDSAPGSSASGRSAE